MVDAMLELLDSSEGTRPLHLSDEINPTAQQDNLDNQEILDENSPLDTSELPLEQKEKNSTKKPDRCQFKQIPRATYDELVGSKSKKFVI